MRCLRGSHPPAPITTDEERRIPFNVLYTREEMDVGKACC